MIPLHDENPTEITPWITYLLIGINIAIFIHQFTLSDGQLNEFFQIYAVVPQQLTGSFNGIVGQQAVSEPLTLITSQFLHGGIAHVGFNMLFLWVFGNNVEEALGHIKFIIFYLACGALAALSQWIFAVDSTIPLIGASGAIAGVMGAYILKYPKAKILTLIPLWIIWTTIKIPAFFFLGFWFAKELLSAYLSLGISSDVGGVAYWAHAGGFAFGAILGPLLGLFSDSSNRLKK